MKIKLFVLGAMLATVTFMAACSDDDDTQGNNMSSKEKVLQGKYPQAANISWKKSKDNKYDIATFILPKTSRAAGTVVDTVNVWFGQNDAIRLVNQEISFQKLPQAVQDKFNKTRSFFNNELYNNELVWELDDVYQLERDGVVSYKLEMDEVKIDREIDLYYDVLGVLLKEIEDDEDAEDDEVPLEIPANIQQWIMANYPDAKILDYEMEENNGAKVHELDLKEEGLITEVELMEKDGKLVVEIEYNYSSATSLPAKILAVLEKVIAGQTNVAITDITEIEMSEENGIACYSIEFEKENIEYSLEITKDSSDASITVGEIETED